MRVPAPPGNSGVDVEKEMDFINLDGKQLTLPSAIS